MAAGFSANSVASHSQPDRIMVRTVYTRRHANEILSSVTDCGKHQFLISAGGGAKHPFSGTLINAIEWADTKSECPAAPTHEQCGAWIGSSDTGF